MVQILLQLSTDPINKARFLPTILQGQSISDWPMPKSEGIERAFSLLTWITHGRLGALQGVLAFTRNNKQRGSGWKVTTTTIKASISPLQFGLVSPLGPRPDQNDTELPFEPTEISASPLSLLLCLSLSWLPSKVVPSLKKGWITIRRPPILNTQAELGWKYPLKRSWPL
jgi:hypothetical protein